MFVFCIEDPNAGLRSVLEELKRTGIEQPSRNGPVVRFPRPVCLEYPNPCQRLLTSPVRDANPVFHLFESMWMLAGMQELEPLLLYNSGMSQYSDDGKVLRGTAYGHRWRNYRAGNSTGGWGDQLLKAAHALLTNHDDRRVVVSMWDPTELGKETKDQACNLQVIFNTRPAPQPGGKPLLDMTVTNRSNDLIYGAMGSNLFHFSILLEYMAQRTGCLPGSYYQVSANLHLYTENPTAARCWEQHEAITPDDISGLTDHSLTHLGLTQEPKLIRAYVENRDYKSDQPYIVQVVVPLVEAYHIFKMKSRTGLVIPAGQRIEAACAVADACASRPLALASQQWFRRRSKPSE
jgi:thymidylate synthase